VLVYEAVPDPQANVGEALIELRAASLNHLDVWIRKGLPSVPKPRILGADGAGVSAGQRGRRASTARERRPVWQGRLLYRLNAATEATRRSERRLLKVDG
jgi:hypothetical protein